MSLFLSAASGREPASRDLFSPRNGSDGALHAVFGALHEEDMQRQGPVCMLLNECFSFSLPPCPVLSEDNNVEGGCCLLFLSPTLICLLFLSIYRVQLEFRR